MYVFQIQIHASIFQVIKMYKHTKDNNSKNSKPKNRDVCA